MTKINARMFKSRRELDELGYVTFGRPHMKNDDVKQGTRVHGLDFASQIPPGHQHASLRPSLSSTTKIGQHGLSTLRHNG